ncbi:hydrogenase maturation nickel metallochaperone HypA [Chloroflexota bacterium]
MHELSVTQSILDIALEKAEEAQASRVIRINLVIGELSSIIDDCIQFYFDFLSSDSMANGATLSFTRIPIQVCCFPFHLINHLGAALSVASGMRR